MSYKLLEIYPTRYMRILRDIVEHNTNLLHYYSEQLQCHKYYLKDTLLSIYDFE